MGNGQDNPHKWFTAGEGALIAQALQVPGVPWTREGMTKLFKRLAADDPYDHASLSRRRKGQKGGGGTEFYWCYFPEALWDELDAEVGRREAAAGWHLPPVMPAKPSHAQIIHRRAAWSRKVAESELVPFSTLSQWEMAALLDIGPGLGWRSAHEACPLRFTTPIIRTVGRCLVKYKTASYFSRALNDWHSRDVLVVACDDHPDLIWCWDYDGHKHRNGKAHIGQLICIAERDGNSAPYFPDAMIRDATQKRGTRRKELSGMARREQIGKE